MCQFYWELDCAGFCPFEIWRCDCVEMMRGIGGEGFFFFHFRVLPEYCRKYVIVLPCLVLSLLLLLVGLAAAVAAAYLPTTELRAPQGARAAVVTGRAIGVATALRA